MQKKGRKIQMGNIVLLDDSTINKIAAGEVIERPASVVKELVENSIDAGATNITIEIRNGGISYIRITDNGKGILPEDMEIAFERHATSKIRQADDLATVKSMGFRGEALASVASISKVEMTSKSLEKQTGYRIVLDGGKIVEKEEAGCPQGTSITITDLFFNTPVRYKFLKKDFTESGYIEDVVTRIALVNPQIAIRYINAGKTIIQTNGSGDVKAVIYSIYGKEIAENCIPVNFQYENLSIYGVVGKPCIARSNRTNQIFFVNQRYIKDKTLTAAAEKGYKGMITIGKFGFLILNIEMPANEVDVNVHPAKLEVRFEDESKIYRAVYHAINNALLSEDLVADKEEEAYQEAPRPSMADYLPKQPLEQENTNIQPITEEKRMGEKEKMAPEKPSRGLFGFRKDKKKDEYKMEDSNVLEDLYRARQNGETGTVPTYQSATPRTEQQSAPDPTKVAQRDEMLQKMMKYHPAAQEELLNHRLNQPAPELNNYEDYLPKQQEEQKNEDPMPKVGNGQVLNDALSKIQQLQEGVKQGKVFSEDEFHTAPSSSPFTTRSTMSVQASNDPLRRKTDWGKPVEKEPEKLEETQIVSRDQLNEELKKQDEQIDNSLKQAEMNEQRMTMEQEQPVVPTEQFDFNEMYAKTFGRTMQKPEEVPEQVEEEQEQYTVKPEEFVAAETYQKEDNVSVFEGQEEFEKPQYKFIGIAFSTYIIIEMGQEIYIIDQHAAHERVMYERVKQNYYSDQGRKESQLMLLPDVITLTNKEMGIARDNWDMFEKAGFMIEEFGENTIRLSGVPNICIDLETKELFLETLDEINTVARTAKQEIEDKFIATVACKAAVKANMALTEAEVDGLMEQLLVLPNPFTCPHGRPTAIKMTKADIEKKFSRR